MEAAQTSAPPRSAEQAVEDLGLTLVAQVIFAILIIWWLKPLLDRLHARSADDGTGVSGRRGGRVPERIVAEAERAAAAAAAATACGLPVTAEGQEESALFVAEPLSFDPTAEFSKVFAEAAGLVGEVLDIKPRGSKYTAATSSLHATTEILDRIILSWTSPDKLAASCRLRETAEAFSRNFGRHRGGNPARKLLKLAGFSRARGLPSGADDVLVEVDDDEKDGGETSAQFYWVFGRRSPHCLFRALTVRVCLEKVKELQRLRGAMRWVQNTNEAVVPRPEKSELSELFHLHRGDRSTALPGGDTRSIRERCLEGELRLKLNERRSEAVAGPPLALHEGLVSAARRLADSRRVLSRTLDGDTRVPGPRPAEVAAVLAELPLPPGFVVAHLHFNSDEIPHIFGLASTTGKGDASVGQGVAEILAREALGFWAARQEEDLLWPSAVICGVGASLDYTVNRGFAVALLVGYEGVQPRTDVVTARAAQLEAQLRQRTPAATAANSGGFGARVRTLGQPTSDAKLNNKSGF